MFCFPLLFVNTSIIILHVSQRIITDDDLTKCVEHLVAAAQQLGHKTGFQETVTHLRDNLTLEFYILQGIDVEAE